MSTLGFTVIYTRIYRLCFTLLGLYSGGLHADHVPEGQVPSLWDKTLDWALVSHDVVAEKVTQTGERVDLFFGEADGLEEINKTYLRIDLSGSVRESEGFDQDSNIKFRIDLPSSKRRLRVIIENDPDDDQGISDRNRDSTLNNNSTDSDSLGAAVRFMNQDHESWGINTDLGLKIRTPLDPYVRIKGRWDYPLNPDWDFRYRQTLDYFKSRGAGLISTAYVERTISDEYFFRSQSEAQWREEKDYYEYGQFFSIFHDVSPDVKAEYKVGFLGNDEKNAVLERGFISANYRTRLYKNWLHYEVVPEIVFPRDEDYDLTPAITIKLEILFTRSE